MLFLEDKLYLLTSTEDRLIPDFLLATVSSISGGTNNGWSQNLDGFQNVSCPLFFGFVHFDFPK